MYNLGAVPDKLKVNLYRDADFDSVLTRKDDAGLDVAWGTTDVRLLFPAVVDPDTNLPAPVTWPAVSVEGAVATFQVDKALTNLRSAGEVVELWVGEQCWAAGTVKKKGVLA